MGVLGGISGWRAVRPVVVNGWQALVVACVTAAAGLWIVAATVAGSVPSATAVGLAGLVPAAVVDARERRLPNRLVAAAGIAVLAVVIAGALDSGSTQGLDAAARGAAIASLPLLVLHMASPSSMGFGDVKAAVVLGASLGVTDVALAIAGLMLAAGLGALVGIVRRVPDIAFGPFLLAGGWLAVIAEQAGAFGPLTTSTGGR